MKVRKAVRKKKTRKEVQKVYVARTQKHYLWNYIQKPKELGIWHVVAMLQEINSMLPYFPPPLNSKLLEDELVEIILQHIPVGWKCTMTCAIFKPLEASMEELIKYLKGVKRLEIENPPGRNPRKNNSNGPKTTKKNKRKRDEDGESHNVTANTMSSKKSRKICKLCKMFGGNFKSHSTECCNKKTLLASLLDGHKKKHADKAKKEEFCAMAKALKKANLKSKKTCKRSIPDSSESESSSDEE
eukprot:2355050-Ditylum_brightwellii.AAC.1